MIRHLLRRKLFKGQFKIFLWLYNHSVLNNITTIAKPIIGNFKINVNTANYIDACIYYTGDYEPYLKKHFVKYIKEGDVVLDVGANIGFHTLYFAELVGTSGKVFAIEPIDINFNALTVNCNLNNFSNIYAFKNAFGSKTQELKIALDINQKNPGAFSLIAEGTKNTSIKCLNGDQFMDDEKIEIINFIKIDVEGFEFEVLLGLRKNIEKFKPIIFFEYDKNYQIRAGNEPKNLFNFLTQFGYNFYQIDGYGNKSKYEFSIDTAGAEILALCQVNSKHSSSIDEA